MTPSNVLHVCVLQVYCSVRNNAFICVMQRVAVCCSVLHQECVRISHQRLTPLNIGHINKLQTCDSKFAKSHSHAFDLHP